MEFRLARQLKLLEDKNLLFRTQGGATMNNPYTIDRPVNEKEKIQSSEKNKIGAAAAELLNDNDSIAIASGTTVLYFAKNIQPTRDAMPPPVEFWPPYNWGTR